MRSQYPGPDAGFVALTVAMIGGVNEVLKQFPGIAFFLMAIFGAVAGHMLAVEDDGLRRRDFNSFLARLVITVFACLLLYLAWSRLDYDLAWGLIMCGVVAVWPKQILYGVKQAVPKVLKAVMPGGWLK